MEKGSYRGRRVNLADYAASCFNPYLFSSTWRAQMGCGASALALLTGVPPEKIAKQNGSAHYSDEFMTRFLRQRRCSLTELTLCRVSAGAGRIGKEHVVLLSQLFRRNEATWGVIFNAIYYHNFEMYYLDALSFLNKPVLSAYLVLHANWRRTEESKPTVAPNHPKKRSVPFSALHIPDRNLPSSD